MGAVAACTWLWKLISWIKTRHTNARLHATEGNRIAKQLLHHATNSEKRADIHLYMTLRAIEFGKEQIKGTIETYSCGILIIIMLLFTVTTNQPLSLQEFDVRGSIVLLSMATTFISFFLLIWSTAILRNIGNGWNTGAVEALEKKLEKHVPGV